MPWSVSISQLLEVLCAKSVNLSETALTQVSSTIQTDTRMIKPGEVFLALRGENFDGHDFVSHAIARGAIAAIVDGDYDNPGLPVLQVSNTLAAYQQLGRWWRDRLNIPVIGVTGSVGKTTTKEIIAAVLATKGRVHKTYGNFNNEIGVPKTL
ncbi:MAG: UDP-N-acetylmuramoyl-tripeptide--D-alanyl-D-alanine ligase, partial [Nodularia sp. (in: Bacteria)]